MGSAFARERRQCAEAGEEAEGPEQGEQRGSAFHLQTDCHRRVQGAVSSLFLALDEKSDPEGLSDLSCYQPLQNKLPPNRKARNKEHLLFPSVSESQESRWVWLMVAREAAVKRCQPRPPLS